MVQFKILTVFPEIISAYLSYGLINKAIEENKLEVGLYNFRDFGLGKHHKVDAPPYGGGAGMVIRPEPIVDTLDKCEKESPSGRLYRILVSPQGATFNQKKAIELSQMSDPIALICGRFEGFDERIREFIDEEVSLGDFVLMGGEIASLAIVEAVARLVPGVIGNNESIKDESFSQGLLEYAQYTRPFDYKGLQVPEVLVSGNHQEIENWRRQNALEKTKNKRKDLYNLYISKNSVQADEV